MRNALLSTRKLGWNIIYVRLDFELPINSQTSIDGSVVELVVASIHLQVRLDPGVSINLSEISNSETNPSIVDSRLMQMCLFLLFLRSLLPFGAVFATDLGEHNRNVKRVSFYEFR